MMISPAYVHAYPLIPGGGLFFTPVGICIVLGAIVPRARMILVWAGLGLGLLAIVLGAKYLKGLPPPSVVQVVFFGAAIIAEAVGFRLFIPRLRQLGERPMLLGTLAIVGAHFLIMIPTFGIPILILALLCLANAAVAWRAPRYPIAAAWFLDGVFKIAVGAAMWLASPVFTS